MLHPNYACEMNGNRSMEKNLTPYADVIIQNPIPYETIQTNLLSLCDQCGLKKETKEISKKLLDTYSLRNPQASTEELQFVSVNCMRHCIKFKEGPEKSYLLPIQVWINHFEYPYQTEDFLQIESLLYHEKEYAVNFTTSWDYFGTFIKAFPLSQTFKKATCLMLEMAFSIADLKFYNAEQIFFGCLLAARTQNDIPEEWILSQTFFEQKALQVREIVDKVYQEELQAEAQEKKEKANQSFQ